MLINLTADWRMKTEYSNLLLLCSFLFYVLVGVFFSVFKMSIFCCSHNGCSHHPKITFQSSTPMCFCWITHQTAKVLKRCQKSAALDLQFLKRWSTCLLPPPRTFPRHHPPKLPLDISEAANKQPQGDAFNDDCHWLPPSFLSLLSRGASCFFSCLAQCVTYPPPSVRPRNNLICSVRVCFVRD